MVNVKMSCIFRIKEAKDSFTSTEAKIADYIIDNKEKIIHWSAQELADVIETSPAALIRFSKKIGYKGFTAMKMDLALDNNDEDEDFDELINEEDSIEVMVKKEKYANEKTISETYKLIDYVQLQNVIDILCQANRIFLLGVAGNGIVCLDFMHKLTRIDKNVIYHEDTHTLLARMAHINKEDAVVAISYGGKTKDVNVGVQYAKDIGAKVIAITQLNYKTPLSKMADISLHIPIEEKEIRLGAISSRNAAFILTDLIYFGIAKRHSQDTKEKLIQSLEIVKGIK